jgi:transposase-like protein
MSVLVGLKNRGVRDVFFLVCDGLKGLPEVVENVWPHTIVQTCVIHYADLPIMPTSVTKALVAAMPVVMKSA